MTPERNKLIIDKVIQLELTDLGHVIVFNEITFNASLSTIIMLLSFLRDDQELAFKQLIDICAVDYLGRSPRFEVVYHLLSLKINARVRIKIAVDDTDIIPTTVNLFSAANWFEREAFDLFGLSFKDHPDLRRILTDYNFQGHPLRKDFPLTGYIEPIYDESQKKVVYNPVNLPQEYRDFDFLSPWEGITPMPVQGILPGDEKAQFGDPQRPQEKL